MVTAANYEPDFHVIGVQRPLPESMDHECQEYVERVSSRQYAEPLITRPVSSDAAELAGRNINESFCPRIQRAHTNSDLANIAHGDGHLLTLNQEHNHHQNVVQDCIMDSPAHRRPGQVLESILGNFGVDTGAAAGSYGMTRTNIAREEITSNQDTPSPHPLNYQHQPSPQPLPFAMDSGQVLRAILVAFAAGAINGAEQAMRNMLSRNLSSTTALANGDDGPDKYQHRST